MSRFVPTVLALALLAPAPAFANPEVARMAAEVELFRTVIGMVHDMDELANSRTGAATMALVGVEDHFSDPRETIEFLEELLAKAGDPAVQRVIRIKLIDLYKNTGAPEKARAQIRSLALE